MKLNFQQKSYNISHHTLDMLLHYLAKYKMRTKCEIVANYAENTIKVLSF